jgi:hypothetical protein
MFIPDPTLFHPGSELSPSRIRIKEFKYFNPKKTKKWFLWFLSTRKYDPGCSSRIRKLIFYPSRIPELGVKKAPDPGSGSATLTLTNGKRIRMRIWNRIQIRTKICGEFYFAKNLLFSFFNNEILSFKM